MKSGHIYIISIDNTRLTLVGSTLDYKKRKKDHLRDLNKNKHPNSYLQRAFNKYGRKSLKFQIVARKIPEIILKDVEDIWIGTTCSRSDDKLGGMNMRDAYRNRFTEEVKRKISDSQKIRVGRKVVILDLESVFIREYNSVIEASKGLGMKSETIINSCKEIRRCKKFICLYLEDYIVDKDYSYKVYTDADIDHSNYHREGIAIGKEKRKKKVILEENGERIEFASRTALANYLGVNSSYITRFLKNTPLNSKYKIFNP